MTAAVYGSRPTRRSKRTKVEIAHIENAIHDVLAEDHPATVRSVFYRLVSRGVVEKTEAEYKSTVLRLLLGLRRARVIPYRWVTDGTRLMRKPTSWSSLDDALFHTAQHYRRALWDNQDAYVEVWSEKEAIAGVLYEVTSEWDVPLMVCRGFSSETFLWGAAQTIKEIGKPAVLYYFGDHDPSGVAAARDVEVRLRGFAPDADITFIRAAVTEEQIVEWDLPTRPTKRTDSRAKTWTGGSVEVDAIPSRQLRTIAEECVTAHIDVAQFRVLEAVEAEERDLLERMTEEYLG